MGLALLPTYHVIDVIDMIEFLMYLTKWQHMILPTWLMWLVWLVWLVSDKIVPSDFTYVISVIGVIDVIVRAPLSSFLIKIKKKISYIFRFCKGPPFFFKKKFKEKINIHYFVIDVIDVIRVMGVI